MNLGGQWPEAEWPAVLRVGMLLCNEGGFIKQGQTGNPIHLTISFPIPTAHKEPGKPRANSLVTLGSQRSSGLFHKQVTVARQASLPGSPQPPRNPLLRQRRVGCYDTDDASDEEEFDGEGDCISLPGTLPGPSRPLTEVNSRHTLMTSSKVMGINSRGEQPQKTVVSKASSVPLLGSSLDLEESVPEGLGDTPSRAANLLASAEAHRGGPGCSGRKELSGSKSSPKLEYKADTGTQSLGNTDPPRSAQQKNDSLGSRHKPVARVSPHHKRPEADARPSTSETVHLTAGADVPCVRATSSKETRPGFHPGGMAEKVTDLLFITWDLSHYPVSEDGVCESVTRLEEGQWLAASLVAVIRCRPWAAREPACVSAGRWGPVPRDPVIDQPAGR